MPMTQQELQTIFESEFNWNNWKKVMNFVFPEFKFNLVQTDLTRDTKAHKQSAGYIKEHGTTQLSSPEMLTLCEILVNDNVRLDRNIKSVRSLVADLAVPNYQTVIAVFHNADNTKWRFTLVVKEFTGANKVFDKKPDSYTYVFGVGEKGRTAAERFFKLASNTSKKLKDLEDAFSVEALSKKFFTEYKAVYQKFVDDIINNPSRLAMFKGSDREKSARDFVKKMMGRLVFLYFLQKKGWLGCKTKWQGGDEQFMKTFVEKAKQNELFYHHYLEPLFFDTLNDKRTKQNEDCIIQKTNFGKVPYLNGGLFEKDENHPNALTLTWENFNAFFDTLNNYNFTIIEDDPEFKEVAVDPEMLGHIFENLLEDNKDKGAFYTPKEIVHYMCQESLYEYLKTYLQQNNVWPAAESDAAALEEALHNFVTQKTAGKVIDFDKPLAKALKEVKICDPAIGSGAFPMGLLNEIFHCVHVLYDASPDSVGPVWDMDSWQPNKVKLNIIQNSIYGVDIEKGAVDIARLRFWLSLIVDEPEPTALPNLDYKIVVGNSLVSKLGDDIIDIDWNANDTSHGLFGAELAEKKKKLLQKISAEQKESFNPESDKKKLAADIRNLKIDLLINQLELMSKLANQDREPKATSFTDKKKFVQATANYHKVLGWQAQVKRLTGIKQKQSEHLDFFDWKLDFPEVMNDQLVDKPGFDIVIGNPPYIRQEAADISKEYFQSNFESFSGKADIYVFFYEKGLNLLSNSGSLCFITSSKFIKAGYGKPLLKLLSEESIFKNVIDFNDLPVFNGITAYPIILIISKNQTQNYSFNYFSLKELPNSGVQNLLNTLKPKILNKINFIKSDFKFIEEDQSILIDKLKLNSVTLREFCGSPVVGIKTGFNEAYITYEKLPHTKDYVFGRDIKKYMPIQTSSRIIFPYDKDYNLIPFQSLGEAKGRLLGHKSSLSSRAIIKEGIVSGNRAWYEFQQINKTIDFNREYIIYPNVSLGGNFTIARNVAIDMTAFIIKSDSYFLLGLLNSKLIEYLMNLWGIERRGGYIEYKSQYVERIPIRSNPVVDKLIEKRVKKLLLDKREGKETIALEKEIDAIVYKLYDLTLKEIGVIDPNFSFTDLEYNTIIVN